jgi:hypothetical protein
LVYRFFRPGAAPYFYYDYIKNRDTIILRHEPYLDEDYFYRRKFIGETFCSIYDIPYNGELPQLFLTPTEEEIALNIINQQPKPVLIIQPNGGPPPQNGQPPFSWYRDLPFEQSQKLVNALSTKYTVLQLRLKEQRMLENTVQVDLPLRPIMALIKYSAARLFIDSFAQHTAASFNLPSTVCWIGTSSKVFGYEMHKNIQTSCDLEKYKDVDSLFEQFPIGPMPHQCPTFYEPENSFNLQEILNTFEL